MTQVALCFSAQRLLPRKPATPFIKWVGGKTRLLSEITARQPPGAAQRRHVEPFMGGAAVFFHRAPAQAVLCDSNIRLVTTYIAVRDQVDDVIARLATMAGDCSDEAYYQRRDRFNSNPEPVELAALFIAINKTCFNGLYRVNRKGEYNVPVGRYANPRILDADTLRAASAALQDVEIRHAGFETVLSYAKPSDFIYFDPPYEPVSKTANFTGYGQDGFTATDQARLSEVFAELDRRGCMLLLSNSDAPLIRDLYRRWNLETVQCPRAVNSKADGRGLVNEVLVRNY